MRSAVPLGGLSAKPIAPCIHAFAGLCAYREDFDVGVAHLRKLHDLVHVEIEVGQDVDLVDYQRVADLKYQRVFKGLVVPFGDGEYHGVLRRARVELRRADEVADVFQHDEVEVVSAHLVESLMGHVRVDIDLTENDLVICTNGCQGDASAYGDQTHAPVVTVKNGEGPSIEMWKKIAAQDPAFGRPEKFFAGIKETSWESWTVDTANKQILDAIQKICKRDPLSGKVVTGGIVTCRDSSWLISWTINRQGQFQEQPSDHCLIWVYGLNCWDDKGDFIKKNMCDCTGIELCAEWLYHIGIPEDQIMELAEKECNTTPCMMPYVTTFFMPRAEGDRPKVVPDGSVNLAFVGQFADTPRDTVFTTEYSIRTGMEAVYTLCNIDRGVPEVWGSVYDIRDLLYATSKLLDGKKPLEFLLPSVLPLLDLVKEPLVNNVVVDLLKKYNIV